MKNEAQKLMLLELTGRLTRSWWTIVAGVCLGLSAALVAIQYTPRVYMGLATIAADVEKLPREFIRPTISDDLEIQLRAVRNAVLSSANLETVAREAFGAPESEEQQAAIVESIARNVRVNFSRQTLVIGIYYRDLDRYRASDIANLLADLFVQENQTLRAESARIVRESLESLTAQTETELSEKKRQLAELLLENPHALESESLNNEQRIEMSEEELAKNEREVMSAWQRVRVLEAQQAYSEPSGRTDDPSPRPSGVPGTNPRISQLEQEIEELLHRVTDNHPDVQAKRREIERIRKANESRSDDESPDTIVSESAAPESPPLPGLDIWDTQIRAAKLDAERLEKQGRQIRQEIAKYQRYLDDIPRVQPRIEQLTREVSILEAQWKENQENIATARSGQQLEEGDYGNPFVITSYAAPPTDPVSPNPIQFLTAGVVGGVVLFVLPVMASGFLVPRIMSEMSLGLLADVPVLAAIPVIATPDSQRLTRRTRQKNFGLSILAASVLCAVVALRQLNLL